MCEDSPKRAFAIFYVLVLICPGEVTMALIDTTKPVTEYVTDTYENASQTVSWYSWLFGTAVTSGAMQNAVSSQMDKSVDQGLQVSSALIPSSFTIRRRRSPPEYDTATNLLSDNELAQPASLSTADSRPWYVRWFGIGSRSTETQIADFQTDQLNAELTNALMANNDISRVSNPKDPDTINGMTPIEIFQYYMPDGYAEDAVVGINKWWYDPANTSYVRSIILLWKVVAFVTPGLGIIEQINFTVAVSKLVWKTTKMYCEGSNMSEISVAVLPDLAYIMFMYRRDEQYISEHTLKPGQTIDISTMDTPEFMKYIHSLQFPPLPEAQEKEIRADASALLDKYYYKSPMMTEEQREFTIDMLVNATKFLAFFKPEGHIKLNSNEAVREQLFTNVYNNLVAVQEYTKT